jgi:hypothetical protein
LTGPQSFPTGFVSLGKVPVRLRGDQSVSQEARTPMSDEMPQFPIGTIVILTAGSREATPAVFRPGDDLAMASATSGKARCRVVALTTERVEVKSGGNRYSLSPAAATLGNGGIADYEGGWVVRSIDGRTG